MLQLGLYWSQAPRKPQERSHTLPAHPVSPRKASGPLCGAAGNAAAARDPSGREPSNVGDAEQGAKGATVFVRGLPLDASQFALQDRMARFGRVQACRWARAMLRSVKLIYVYSHVASCVHCAVAVLAIHHLTPHYCLSVLRDLAGWCWTSRRASPRALPLWNI